MISLKCRIAFASRLLGTAATESLLIIAVAIIFLYFVLNALVSEFLCNRIIVSVSPSLVSLTIASHATVIAAVPISAHHFDSESSGFR